ncbi:hypothetical protein C8N46_10223 [Kordia periserrulae]|uniref:Uncharacterized protein n=1 Tax=Kordia periserrulae TaxID=701523 RepID=A0A2T6C2W4_9FLAO|nr:DUF6768 family protein [Kordia periserrulae]PTX62628.1 hypothetical protein C8N46_10223 [Kordia periserrulae]
MSTLHDIDNLIKETLTEEEAKFYDELDEQGLIGSIKSIFSGKLGWLAVIMNIINLGVFGFLMYSFIQFFNVTETNELIKWGLAIGISISFMSMIKLYAWMQMDKRAILREMKRLELQVSSLSSKISE